MFEIWGLIAGVAGWFFFIGLIYVAAILFGTQMIFLRGRKYTLLAAITADIIFWQWMLVGLTRTSLIVYLVAPTAIYAYVHHALQRRRRRLGFTPADPPELDGLIDDVLSEAR